MNTGGKISVVFGLLVVIGVTLAIKQKSKTTTATPPAIAEVASASASTQSARATAPAEEKKPLPRLVDLGATKCIPCKQMAPILEGLKKEYARRMDVEFIDVWENPNAGEKYGIRMIPTQIFFDATGKERFRHEGFFSKEDILGKWKELGISFREPG